MHTQASIFERAKALVADAESIGVVIKLNMPATKEVADFKSRRFMTVANSVDGTTMMDPIPNVTGCLLNV